MTQDQQQDMSKPCTAFESDGYGHGECRHCGLVEALHRDRDAAEAIAVYCDELGIKVHTDADGPAVWLGDEIRAGAWRHHLRS